MKQNEYTTPYPTFKSEAELNRWIASRKVVTKVWKFSFRSIDPSLVPPDTNVYKLWVIMSEIGSGNIYRDAFIARESMEMFGQIQIVAAATARMYGEPQVEFDPKRYRVKIYGRPAAGDLGYPHETLLMEYCLGSRF